MTISNLGVGKRLAAVSALVLFASMFMSWYALDPDALVVPDPDPIAYEVGASPEEIADHVEEQTAALDEINEELERREEQAAELADEVGLAAVPKAGDQQIGFSAWEAFDYADLVLVVAVIAALGMALLGAVGRGSPLPVAASVLVAVIGGLATLVLLFRVIDPPLPLVGREPWLFLGLVATAALAIGGRLAMDEDDASFTLPDQNGSLGTNIRKALSLAIRGVRVASTRLSRRRPSDAPAASDASAPGARSPHRDRESVPEPPRLDPGDRVELIERTGYHDAGAAGVVVALASRQVLVKFDTPPPVGDQTRIVDMAVLRPLDD